MSDDLVNRLRDAHANSTQRIVGSNIFNDAAQALTEARAEIERLRAGINGIVNCQGPMTRAQVREACAEILDNKTVGIDNQSPFAEAMLGYKARALAAESELSTLRARASELAGENTNLRNDLVQRGMAEESLHEARCLEISDLIKTRLLGVAPDDQDLVLEDSDWAHIIQALERVAP